MRLSGHLDREVAARDAVVDLALRVEPPRAWQLRAIGALGRVLVAALGSEELIRDRVEVGVGIDEKLRVVAMVFPPSTPMKPERIHGSSVVIRVLVSPSRAGRSSVVEAMSG